MYFSTGPPVSIPLVVTTLGFALLLGFPILKQSVEKDKDLTSFRNYGMKPIERKGS
jgi:hypothetical protein